MVVVATVAEYAVASDRRMGTPAVRRGDVWRAAPGRPREHVEVDRPRPCRIRGPARAASRNPIAGGAPGEACAGGIAPPATGGDRRVGSRGRALASRCARVRGPAVGRPELARSDASARGARRAGAAAHPRDSASRVPTAMELAL